VTRVPRANVARISTIGWLAVEMRWVIRMEYDCRSHEGQCADEPARRANDSPLGVGCSMFDVRYWMFFCDLVAGC